MRAVVGCAPENRGNGLDPTTEVEPPAWLRTSTTSSRKTRSSRSTTKRTPSRPRRISKKQPSRPSRAWARSESIQDILAKQEATETAKETAEEDDEVVPLDLARDDRAEPIDTKIVPMQETEFMCKRCYLVKHRSQLADKKKMLCRDCA